MPPRSRRAKRYANVDYTTGWYRPAANRKYGKWGDRSWGEFFYDVSPLGIVMPRKGKNQQEMYDESGYMPYKPEILKMFPDPLRPTKSTASAMPKKMRVKNLRLPQL